MLTDNQLRKVNALRARAVTVGVAGVILAAAIGLLTGGTVKLFLSFLIASVFWLALGVGCLALVMLHHLCGGTWSFMIQRINEAGARTLPFLMIVLAVVLLGALGTGVYPWSDPQYLESHEIVGKKAAFLNPQMFILCTVAFFAVWYFFMNRFITWSAKLDQTGDILYAQKMQRWAAPGLILYVLTMTFAATTWLMSLEPDWFSTIYGAWLIAGFNLTVAAFSVIALSYLSEEGVLHEKATTKNFHHLGNFLLGFTVFWAYISFSQYLIIWNANLPEEIGWYLHRQGNTLQLLTVFLIVFHWFIPMMILLIRRNKTDVARLRKIAFYILAVRIFDLYWNIAPALEPNTIRIGTLLATLSAWVGIGGFWVYVYLGRLQERPLLPTNDPRSVVYFLKEEADSHA